MTATTVPPRSAASASTWLAATDSTDFGPPPPVNPWNTGPAENTPPTIASTHTASTHQRRRKHHRPNRPSIPGPPRPPSPRDPGLSLPAGNPGPPSGTPPNPP